MTPDDFRNLALSLPEAVEGAHMNHPDFRVGGKIFATLWPDQHRGVVMLKPDQQAWLMQQSPAVFDPVPGGWGRQGSTTIHLAAAPEPIVQEALLTAWRNKAPKSLLER